MPYVSRIHVKASIRRQMVLMLIGRSPHNVMTCMNTNTGLLEVAEQISCVMRNLAVSLRGIIGIRIRLSNLPTQSVLFELLH